jgi:nucleotide-binding universal stress UspA family protein
MNKKIMVALDGSKEAECVLPYIKTLACGFETPAKVILYSAIETISSPFEELFVMKMDDPEQKGQYEDALLIYLRNIAGNLRAEGVDVEEAVAIALASDDVAEDILSFIDKNNIDLIVISTHAKSRKSKRPFGSVACTLLEQSKIPVLLVPTPGYRKRK